MSGKRGRAAYEADLQAQQSPFVAYGTPLPPLDPDVRDDGSYVPVWKQEVTDERGRKRLHGAFTGGFSAGYFNTVGSKEGWTPSTFVSSRLNRRKDDPKAQAQRPEDYMDEEDLADAAEAQRVHTADGFSGLGSTQDETSRRGALVDLFRTEGETMGVKLLKRMGWREGQGVGPKVRRKARLGGIESDMDANKDMHMFAPENTSMISFVRKNDHKGLGFSGEAKLGQELREASKSDDEDDRFGTATHLPAKKQKPKKSTGIGIGILNDTGSDDEDPYEIGPRISYNKVIGGEKKKKKPIANGAIRPVFISKKNAIAKAALGLRKCHDGRLPLDGFVLSSNPEVLSSIITSDGKYLPPEIPEGWTSKRVPSSSQVGSDYTSTADAARASKLDPKARASILGEAALPGKSVFDFLSSAARDRLAAASGKTNLPPALGEVPEGYKVSEKQRRHDLFSQIPKIDREVAIAALGRGATGWMPYSEDEDKRARYRAFLESQAGIRESVPDRDEKVTREDWLKELQEFVHCAQIFKPISGLMASRFTTSSTAPKSSSGETDAVGSSELLSKPAPKPEDPAEAAAKMGMFGPMTRSSQDFYPTRLLCKRFNVKPPAHVQLDPERAGDDTMGGGASGNPHQTGNGFTTKSLDLVSKTALDEMLRASYNTDQQWGSTTTGSSDIVTSDQVDLSKDDIIEPERNEALEGQKAGAEVFKAIFGDDDDDDD